VTVPIDTQVRLEAPSRDLAVEMMTLKAASLAEAAAAVERSASFRSFRKTLRSMAIPHYKPGISLITNSFLII